VTRVVVLGPGSIGRRHLENLRLLGHDAVAYSRSGRDGALDSLDAVLDWAPEAVVIATPTSEHGAGLAWAVANGLHSYVEKPIAASPAGISEILADAGRRKLAVAVGYNLRFHPALVAIREAVKRGRLGRLLTVRAEVGQQLGDWHPGEDFRSSYVARRDLGGGAVLTLSHELDYVRWIVGEISSVDIFTLRDSPLQLEVDVAAELVCRHTDGTLSSVHVDLLDRSYNRRSRWVGEAATVEWRWGEPAVLLPGGEELWSDPAFDLDDTYRDALRDFLSCAASGGTPRADGLEGLRVLELTTGTGG
jgi:predicted dehydrogenase